LGSNIILNTLSLCSSLNVSDQVSHPYKHNQQNYSSVYLNYCRWQVELSILRPVMKLNSKTDTIRPAVFCKFSIMWSG
jgi:hypothetical protein